MRTADYLSSDGTGPIVEDYEATSDCCESIFKADKEPFLCSGATTDEEGHSLASHGGSATFQEPSAFTPQGASSRESPAPSPAGLSRGAPIRGVSSTMRGVPASSRGGTSSYRGASSRGGTSTLYRGARSRGGTSSYREAPRRGGISSYRGASSRGESTSFRGASRRGGSTSFRGAPASSPGGYSSLYGESRASRGSFRGVPTFNRGGSSPFGGVAAQGSGRRGECSRGTYAGSGRGRAGSSLEGRKVFDSSCGAFSKGCGVAKTPEVVTKAMYRPVLVESGCDPKEWTLEPIAKPRDFLLGLNARVTISDLGESSKKQQSKAIWTLNKCMGKLKNDYTEELELDKIRCGPWPWLLVPEDQRELGRPIFIDALDVAYHFGEFQGVLDFSGVCIAIATFQRRSLRHPIKVLVLEGEEKWWPRPSREWPHSEDFKEALKKYGMFEVVNCPVKKVDASTMYLAQKLEYLDNSGNSLLEQISIRPSTVQKLFKFDEKMESQSLRELDFEARDALQFCLSGSPWPRTVGAVRAAARTVMQQKGHLLSNDFLQFAALGLVDQEAFKYMTEQRLVYAFVDRRSMIIPEDYRGSNI